MKKLNCLKKTTKIDFATYLGVIVVFVVMTLLQNLGLVSRSLGGMLVPICCYIAMAVSLNLTVGILGELSLGHAGFMSVGAFAGVITAMGLQELIPSGPVRLVIAMVVGTLFAALAGFVVGIPVLRLRGDYLAIVTLAFGEILKNIISNLYISDMTAVTCISVEFPYVVNFNYSSDNNCILFIFIKIFNLFRVVNSLF